MIKSGFGFGLDAFKGLVGHTLSGGVGGYAPMQTPLWTWDELATNQAGAPNGSHAIVDMPGMPGVRALRTIPDGAAYYLGSFAGTKDLSAIDYLHIPILPGDTNTTSGVATVNIYIASGAAGSITNRVSYNNVGFRSKAPGRPFILTLALKQLLVITAGSQTMGYSAAAGTIDWSAIKSIGFQVSTVGTGTGRADATYYIGDPFISARRHPTKGQVMVTLDGQYESQFTDALPYAESVGVAVGLAVQRNTLGTAGVGTQADVVAASAAGHKILLHSNERNLNTNDATTFPDAATIASDIAGFNAWASGLGLNTVPSFAPIAVANPWENAPSFAHETRARDGYELGGLTALREGNAGYGFMMPNHRIRGVTPMQVFTTPLTPTTNVVDIAKMLDDATTKGGLISLYTHGVLEVGAGNGTSIAIWEAVMDAIAARVAGGTIEVITPDQYFR